MKVLIAEDSLMVRSIIEKHVRNWGYEATAVENGIQAWKVLQSEDAPRLALLDWQMPEMDGIEVCRRLKRSESHPFTYVVMLTSRDAKEDIIAGLNAGADDYLTKPIDPPMLRSRLEAAKRIVEAVPPKEWSRPRVPGYDVKQLLGKGAFATVWHAIQESSGETVALKIIRVDLATAEVFNRFAREIRLLQKMDHPNIARIFDSHIDEKLGYCAMEFIDGCTLDKYVKQERPKASRIIRLIIKVAHALDYAHDQGILHRDLKPSNIMLTKDNLPKIVDFGLGKSIFQKDEAENVESLDGSVIGSPLFMAPEQARGQHSQLDGRADIYSLGTILYIFLLRRHPCDVEKKDRWETVRELADGQARSPSELQPGFDPQLEQVMMKALDADREMRYETAGEFGDALENFLVERRRRKLGEG